MYFDNSWLLKKDVRCTFVVVVALKFRGVIEIIDLYKQCLIRVFAYAQLFYSTECMLYFYPTKAIDI